MVVVDPTSFVGIKIDPRSRRSNFELQKMLQFPSKTNPSIRWVKSETPTYCTGFSKDRAESSFYLETISEA